jgi:hypothetical protein
MPNEIYQKPKTAIVIADSADYAGDLGARTDQIDLTSLASGAARESAKVDLETLASGLLAVRFAVFVAIEFAIAPSSGDRVDVWMGFSPDAAVGAANPGGLSGADGAYTGTAGDSLDDSLKQLDFLGALIATSDATTVVQFQAIGWFVASERYVSFVIDNNADQALVADAVEMGIRLIPYVDEVQ